MISVMQGTTKNLLNKFFCPCISKPKRPNTGRFYLYALAILTTLVQPPAALLCQTVTDFVQ
jgi:hypothetical protein